MMRSGIALHIGAVLMKPVQREELLDNIYRVLSRGVVVTEIAEATGATAQAPSGLMK